MPLFQCSECQGTFRYDEESPVEWKPHCLYQAATNTFKTACFPCFNIESAKTAALLLPCAADYDIEAVVRYAYLNAGGMLTSYPNWCRKWDTVEERAEWLQHHGYGDEWRRAYKHVTGKEWAP